MAAKLQTPEGRRIYRARKRTVEPVIGILKEVLGFRQFSLRGQAAAAGEWCLVCLAYNLKRLQVLLGGLLPSVALAQAKQRAALVQGVSILARCRAWARQGRLYLATFVQCHHRDDDRRRAIARAATTAFSFSPTGC